MEVRAITNQSLLDLAIQTGGTIEAVFDLAVANDLSITDALEAGQLLVASTPRNKPVSDYYRVKGLTPATGLSEDESQEGIEFWAVQRDFAVN